MIDTIPRPVGHVALRVFRGEVLEREEGQNLVLDAALPGMVSFLTGRIAKIGFGSAGNAPTPTDAALATPFIKAVASVTNPDPRQIRVEFSLEGIEANALNIQELGLLAADGTLLARRTRAPLFKTPDLRIEGVWTLTYPARTE